MASVTVINVATPDEVAVRQRIAHLLSVGIYVLLLLLIVCSSIPYGTLEPWWKALFVCFVFGIAILAVVEFVLTGATKLEGLSILAPMVTLVVFSFLQTIQIGHGPVWKAISADPYETRFVTLQLLALTVALALLYRYVNSRHRIRILIHVVLCVGAASAVYGIIGQTTQNSPDLFLPLVKPDQGYGQFINKNHFAYLMEMVLGLGLGLMVAGGLKRERVLMYVAMLMPVWTALVLSNSRGGILAMLAQVVIATLLLMRVLTDTELETNGPVFRFAHSFVARAVLLGVLFVVVLSGVVWVGGDRLLGTLRNVSGEFNPNTSGLNEGTTRNEIWRASWKMFTAHPITGVGLGGYWVAITEYHEASGKFTPQEAHNDYLELLVSGGIVGFAIGIWFVVVLYTGIRREWRSADRFRRAVCFAATLGITGVAVHSLVDFGLHILVNALIFLVLIMLATTTVGFREESRI